MYDVQIFYNSLVVISRAIVGEKYFLALNVDLRLFEENIQDSVFY